MNPKHFFIKRILNVILQLCERKQNSKQRTEATVAARSTLHPSVLIGQIESVAREKLISQRYFHTRQQHRVTQRSQFLQRRAICLYAVQFVCGNGFPKTVPSSASCSPTQQHSCRSPSALCQQ